MATHRTITIKSPIGGINRKVAYQDQPPYTTYDSLGFLPFDCKTGRRRISTQPGWVLFGPAANPNLIATLNVASGETYQRLLVVANSGTLKTITDAGATTTPSTTGAAIATGRNVQAAPYGNQLFIANGATQKVYTFGTAPGMGGTSSTNINWVAGGGLGTVPANCILICEFGGRIVLAGDPAHPNIVNMSRVDDPFDWQFAANDSGSPCASSDLSGGTIQEPVIDLIPHNRSCLLAPSSDSFYIYRGNPTDGGTLEKLCYGVGLTNRGAWCKTGPDDWTYFLSRDGLYRMEPGCGSPPKSVSREKIPDSLKSVDGVSVRAYLTYDVLFRGVIIATTAGECWWFDIETEGFSRMIGPGTVTYGAGRFSPAETADKSGALIGTSTGLFRLDRTTAIGGSTKPYTWLSVSKLTPSANEKSQITSARPIFSQSTTDTDGTLDFFCAPTVEEVISEPDDRHFSCTIEDGQVNTTVFPDIGGHALGVKLTMYNTSDHVSFEEMPLQTRSYGSER